MDPPTLETLARVEEHVRCRLVGLVHDFRVLVRDRGLVLQGQSPTYYAKQLAQQAVMVAVEVPIVANEIEVG